ncbi:hypothetical protein E2C01_071749 [Portunus trituberculatus]|uniref:Uncharacterized protein n=1 Tax=Portunus trituberculatus TaxID=210409 RepID=A0A5B7I8U7_PORTR|nr:hypothetical protein [Portunus trituberculatus]
MKSGSTADHFSPTPEPRLTPVTGGAATIAVLIPHRNFSAPCRCAAQRRWARVQCFHTSKTLVFHTKGRLS